MRSAKLQLENYFVEELYFQLQQSQELNINEPPKLKPSDLDVEIRLGERKEETQKKLCHLILNLKEEVKKTFPYDFRISIIGFFEIDSSCLEDEVNLLLKTTAPSILFTASRELLLTVTGRARYFPLMLPTVVFLPNTKEQKPDNTESKSKKENLKSKKTSTRKTK